MVKFTKFLGSALVITSFVYGAETVTPDSMPTQRRQNSPRQGFRGGQRRGNFGFGGSMFSRFTAEKQIQEKFPKEVEALNKQLLEIEAKYAELAKQAKVDLPVNMETKLRQLRAAKPAEFAKIETQAVENPRMVMRELTKLAETAGIQLFPPRPNRQGNMRDVNKETPAKRNMARPNFTKLRKNFPAEMAKYEELRKTKPNEARLLLQELMKKSSE